MGNHMQWTQLFSANVTHPLTQNDNFWCTQWRKCQIYNISVSVTLCRLGLQLSRTVYPKKYAHGYCFAVLCCGWTLTDFPISIRLTSLALWQSNDCPSASKATLINMDKYFMWIHYERLHNHNKAKHNKTVCIFLGIYCMTCVNIGAGKQVSSAWIPWDRPLAS